MLLKILGFDGLQPASDQRLLPDNKATLARDTRLVNGTLRSWRPAKFVTTLPKVGNILSIYRWGQDVDNEDSYWFHWTTDVDVVRGPVPDENTERTYWTGDPPWPKYTYSPLAITGGSNYPAGSHRLGVPAPTPAPSVAAGTVPPQDAVETARPVDITSIEAESSTLAKVTLKEPTDFDREVATKIAVSGAVPPQYNGLYDVAWIDDTHLNYTIATTDNPPTSPATKTLEVQTISRFDDTTVQIALKENSDFVAGVASTTVSVSGCNVLEYNGTYKAVFVEESRVLQYHPTKPNQTVDLQMPPDFVVGKLSDFVGIITLTGATQFDRSASVVVTLQGIVTPNMLNSTFTGAWDATNPLIITFPTGTTIPAGPVVGPPSPGVITLTLGGPLIVPLPPRTPVLDVCTIRGTISNELPVGEDVEGVTQVYLSGEAVPEDKRGKEARNYVVTFVTPLGEEGPPSEASEIVEVVAGQEVTLTSIPLPPSGEGWNLPSSAKKRLYRSATSGASAVYLFVAELDIATTDYTDSLDADELAEALASEDWNPPHVDLKGLCLLGNGGLAAFKNNEVWFSEPNLPHAWPSRNMVALGDNVVGIGAFGNSLLAATKGTPVILSGADPAAMTPIKLPIEQSCLSKRGVMEVAGGVMYPSPDGLCLADGNGIKVLTEQLMSRDQWQSYNPASLVSASHDFRYYGFFTRTDGTKGTIVLDLSGAGAALWTMEGHYVAAHNDVGRDGLYVVDASRQLWRLHDGDGLVAYEWRSKVFDVPLPTNFGAAHVLADSYPVTFRVWHDNVLADEDGAAKYTVEVLNDQPFRLPSGFRARFWKFGVQGTATIYSVMIAHGMGELTGG